jgi:hypothetical protein
LSEIPTVMNASAAGRSLPCRRRADREIAEIGGARLRSTASRSDHEKVNRRCRIRYCRRHQGRRSSERGEHVGLGRTSGRRRNASPVTVMPANPAERQYRRNRGSAGRAALAATLRRRTADDRGDGAERTSRNVDGVEPVLDPRARASCRWRATRRRAAEPRRTAIAPTSMNAPPRSDQPRRAAAQQHDERCGHQRHHHHEHEQMRNRHAAASSGAAAASSAMISSSSMVP